MTNRTVPLTLPNEVWGRLASLAERKGVKVADLVASAVAALVPDLNPQHGDGETGAPGHRLEVLNAEVSAARRARAAKRASA